MKFGGTCSHVSPFMQSFVPVPVDTLLEPLDEELDVLAPPVLEVDVGPEVELVVVDDDAPPDPVPFVNSELHAPSAAARAVHPKAPKTKNARDIIMVSKLLREPSSQ